MLQYNHGQPAMAIFLQKKRGKEMTVLNLDSFRKKEDSNIDVEFNGKKYQLENWDKIGELANEMETAQLTVLRSNKDVMAAVKGAAKRGGSIDDMDVETMINLAAAMNKVKAGGAREQVETTLKEFFDNALLTDGEPSNSGDEIVTYLGVENAAMFENKLKKLADDKAAEDEKAMDKLFKSKK